MKNIEAGLGASKKTDESSLWKNFKTLGDLLEEDKKLNDQIEKINNTEWLEYTQSLLPTNNEQLDLLVEEFNNLQHNISISFTDNLYKKEVVWLGICYYLQPPDKQLPDKQLIEYKTYIQDNLDTVIWSLCQGFIKFCNDKQISNVNIVLPNNTPYIYSSIEEHNLDLLLCGKFSFYFDEDNQ